MIPTTNMGKVKGKKPELDPIFPGDLKQLDFSSLSGKTGWDWAKQMGHKQEFLQNMTILRVYNGHYGLVKDKEGNIAAGGLETHILELDRQFAKKFPMKIHVICRAMEDEAPRTIKQEGWKGEVIVHPIPHFGAKPGKHDREVVGLAREIDADVIHIHNPHGTWLA